MAFRVPVAEEPEKIFLVEIDIEFQDPASLKIFSSYWTNY